MEPPSPNRRRLLVAAAALVAADGRILVQRRPAGSDFAGLWEFPGGKLEAGESPRAALIRELREELAVAVEEAGLTPAGFSSEVAGDRDLLLLLFVCRTWNGTPRALQAAELRWAWPAELHGLSMPPADRPLVSALEALL